MSSGSGPAGLDKDAAVVIATIQRVYSLLTGRELSEEDEEASAFETGASEPQRLVRYNPAIPIESFDLVITDECHRSIYGTWRQVLEYFDAFIVGLTATPSLHTMGFFGKNLVAQYPYERSVATGSMSPSRSIRIRTEIGERGGAIPKGYRAAGPRQAHPGRALRGTRRRTSPTRRRNSTARCSCRTRSAPCSKPIATACSPNCFPAAPRCRRP